MTSAEKKIKKLVVEYLINNNLSLEDVRTGREACDLPIGGRGLWAIVKNGKRISYKQQIQLLEFFGYTAQIKYTKQ